MVAFAIEKKVVSAGSKITSGQHDFSSLSAQTQLYAMEYFDQSGTTRIVVIKTVIPLSSDKFAMMSFRGKVLTLFKSQILGWEPVLVLDEDPYPAGWWEAPVAGENEVLN
ncbi:hypothetical protein [Rhizobium alvei]|uniref:Uncharacterized protein n=1 Tax=Rhizobium alvei TaxID=1132659 RepID=A0ABT8YPZ8_9HYPH|nr:hypothetical protein [Rhizobium alvei]MDO6965803.1 hypothetical protein [Rhizobium alvei]